jgi:S-formylglutathione hydrolase FrmB
LSVFFDDARRACKRIVGDLRIGMQSILRFVWLVLASLSIIAAVAGATIPTRMLPFDGTVWNNPRASLPPGAEHHTYRSAIMNVDVGYNIYLPPQYAANPTERFPVIYWLHGLGGDERSDVYRIVKAKSAASPAVIIVFVNGGRNSKYMDAAVGSRMHGVVMAESTIVNELIPHIDAGYRTMASKAGRAIQGFSMGGMGALRLAFKYPQLFSSVFAVAPAVDDDDSNVMANEPALMAAMFNKYPSLFADQTVQTLASNNAAKIRGLPIHIVVGSKDGLLPYNQALDTLLSSMSIPHDPLEIVAEVGHDLNSPRVAVGSRNVEFAIMHFHQ